MRRGIAGIALLAIILAGAAFGYFTMGPKQRAHSKSTPAQSGRKPARPAAAAEPMPPMKGRVAIAPDQLSDALAKGIIDHPVKTLLDVPARMTYGDYVWNDTGVPAGPAWIRVDLASQIISVFRSGHEIGTAVILYGTDGLPTPTGKFPILAKWKDHVSITYDNAPMPYTLRLTNDGVSIHGSNVRYGLATHGCVGVPKDFAAKMFDVVSKGDEVLIVSGRQESKPA